MVIHNIVHKELFKKFVDFAIIVNCIFLAVEDAQVAENGRGTQLGSLIYTMDILFTVLFLMEMVMKVIALGFQEKPFGQTRDWEKERIPPFASYKHHSGEKFRKRGFEELLMEIRPAVGRGFEKAHVWAKRCSEEAYKCLTDTEYINSIPLTSLWMKKYREHRDTWRFGIDTDKQHPFAKGKLDFEK
eukprot:UN23429